MIGYVINENKEEVEEEYTKWMSQGTYRKRKSNNLRERKVYNQSLLRKKTTNDGYLWAT